MNKDISEVIDDTQPRKDYLQGKTSTFDFIEKCREISSTENAQFEVVEIKQLPWGAL